MPTNYFDVIILGSGPAGSVAGRRAAQLGLSALILEKEQFPRFHIGESLLPYMSGLLNQLGLLEKVRDQGHPVKSGAEFTNTQGQFHRVCFTDQGPGRFHTTFQVDRARFDDCLQRAAADAGATVHAPAEGVELTLATGEDDHQVTYTHDGTERTARAPYVIDATGRAGLISRQLDLRRPVERLRMVAVYRHYNGLDEDDNPGWDGDIQIGNHPEGWVWAIPNTPGGLSVGAVMRKPTLRAAKGARDELFEEHISRVPRIMERLRSGKPVHAQTTQEADFCYLSEEVAGDRWFIVGDAAAFVDPVFSGGVYLAMATGLQAANEIAAVRSGNSNAQESRDRFTATYKTGYDTYFRLVQGFYDYDFDFGRFRADLPDTVDDKSISLLLGGDFWGQANTFAHELRKVDRWGVFEPFTPRYGCPAYPELELAERHHGLADDAKASA